MAIIDRGAELLATELAELERKAELAELERKAELGFAWKRTSGYLHDLRSEELLDSEFPRHRGAQHGTVEAVCGGLAAVRREADLSLRDGLQYFPSG